MGQCFALLKIDPDNFLFAAIPGAHPLGQCFALLKIDPDNFLVCNVTMHTELQDDLVTALEAFLLSRQGEISEQELLHQLKAFFPEPRSLAVDSLLFQQHFILYHHLFVLQAQWQQEQVALLHIGYAKVIVYTVTALPDNAMALWQEQQDKAAYYLDWQNMRAMTDDKLQTVLDEFWKKLALYQQNKTLDTAVLQKKWQLVRPYSVAQLKKNYRQQALRLHPDKGGDAAAFQLLQQEYQWLLAEFSS
ncbi:DnaJ-class molecular chaperone with C-terminal Zn finger domain protein [Rheinheimera sp. A13L]|nr:DnaJ-class molecular chaperone with C-terminal Zn finger domain protein [Rheinheimera sp. A13L]